jgi:hypothetical protein
MEWVLLALFLLMVFFFVLIAIAGIAIFLGGWLTTGAAGVLPIPETPGVIAQPLEMPADMARYFELKNRSCSTLAGQVLIVTEDITTANVTGLGGGSGEQLAMDLVLKDYLFNQTTKTYLRGDKMKLVTIAPEGNVTRIWKDNRIYECSPNCTMHLLTQKEDEEYRARLEEIRTSCAYFGNTELPGRADAAQLLSIRLEGTKELYGHRCDSFLITGNASYAQSLLESDGLTAKQKELLWAVGHFAAPMHECLDVNSGIVVSRETSFDLADAYLFEFLPGGHMHVLQTTRLTYFDNKVPDSFFALPS